MVGSGADAPVQGSSVTRPQNRACTFQCTRLALYVFLEMLFVRECACMKLVMAATAKNECLPVTSRHHTLPERLSFCYIFQFSHVMHLKRPFRRFTVLALLPVEPFDNLVHARFVLVRQGFQKTRLPDPFQLVQGLFHTRCQGVIVCQSPKLSVVGKNDFGIGEVHPLRFVSRLASSIVSVSSLRTELLHFVLGDMKLDLFRERFYPGVAGATLELDNTIC